MAVRERRASRGARDEPEAAALVGRRGRDDFLATGRPDDAEHLGVRGERLGDLDCERRVHTQLRVAVDDLDLLVLVRLLRVPALDVVLRPANLLVADVGRGACERGREADRARLAARHGRRCCRIGSRRLARRFGRPQSGCRQNGHSCREERGDYKFPHVSLLLITRYQSETPAASFVCLIGTRGGIAGGVEDRDDLHRRAAAVLERVLPQRRQVDARAGAPRARARRRCAACPRPRARRSPRRRRGCGRARGPGRSRRRTGSGRGSRPRP